MVAFICVYSVVKEAKVNNVNENEFWKQRSRAGNTRLWVLIAVRGRVWYNSRLRYDNEGGRAMELSSQGILKMPRVSLLPLKSLQSKFILIF